MRLHLLTLLLWASLSTACTGQLFPNTRTAETRHSNEFVIVTAKAGDTFSSLAATHLKDRDKAWQIAAFNQTETLSPGQRIVIPLVPITPGGLQKNGYQTIPVLLYSGLAANPSSPQTVSSRTFQRQLDYLTANGYTTVTTGLFHGFLELKEQPPPKAVVISLDTTEAWAHAIAYPALQQRGMTATLFIDPGEVGRKGNLTWNQLAEMAGSGWDIGLYGPKIKTPAKEDVRTYIENLETAIIEPQKAFLRYLKRPCLYFAYDRGRSNDLTIALLKKHGYKAAFTRKRGSNPFFVDNYKIKRYLVLGQYDMARFRQMLATFRSTELQ